MSAANTDPRDRKQTEKGKAYNDDRAQAHRAGFFKAYETWKVDVRDARRRMKDRLNDELLEDLRFTLEERQQHVGGHYEDLVRLGATEAIIVKKMDTCNQLTTSTIDLIERRIGSESADATCKAETRLALMKEDNRSIFGDSITVTSAGSEQDEIRDHSDERTDGRRHTPTRGTSTVESASAAEIGAHSDEPTDRRPHTLAGGASTAERAIAAVDLTASQQRLAATKAVEEKRLEIQQLSAELRMMEAENLEREAQRRVSRLDGSEHSAADDEIRIEVWRTRLRRIQNLRRPERGSSTQQATCSHAIHIQWQSTGICGFQKSF